jgi:hypothetical protein
LKERSAPAVDDIKPGVTVKLSLQNRFVIEVRNGMVLFLNQTTDADDGWWWGSDEDPLLEGPFASSTDAVVDARRGSKFKVTYVDKEFIATTQELPANGHVVVFDTKGMLLVKTGERPPTDEWSPKN